ncbi:MAG: hypothetical protein HY591_05385 [Candidatus Omnitrophica bacterium]|nr:hypothetical protein [Candidatus Omnitrophota bacterium]
MGIFLLRMKAPLTIMLGILFSQPVLADGPSNVYKVTVTLFEMYNGTSWVTVSNGSSTTIDIAAANSGQAAGNFFAGLNVPDGTYTQVRVTPSAVFTVKGNDGAGRYTTAANGPNGGCVYSNSAAAEAECLVTVPGGITPTPDTLSTPITITNGIASHKVRVNFDTSTAIQYNGLADELFPGQPTVTMTLIPQ